MICKKCDNDLDLLCFSASSLKRCICRYCIKIQSDQYYTKNRFKILENKKIDYNSNKDSFLVKNKTYYLLNKDKLLENNKIYRENNKEKINIQRFLYRRNNKIKIALRQYLYEKRKMGIISYRFRKNIATVVRRGLVNKKDSTFKLLGYTVNELIIHLDGLFEPWMNWENYGKYLVDSWDDNDQATWRWNIDHIIPQSSFSRNSFDEFLVCWEMKNLRPYSAKQNLLDGNKR